jgi:CheY-like chemotaxis protein
MEPIKKPPVLVAEDNEVDALLIETLLKDFYDVTICATGTVAMEQLKLNKYDLLITDLEMPVMGGIELLVVTEALYATMPIIVVSGHSWEYAGYRDKYPNVKQWVDKPYKPSVLLGLIAGTIANHTG